MAAWLPLDAVLLGMGEDGHFASLFAQMPGLEAALDPTQKPAGLLAHAPTMRILAASYARSLATKHSVDCRAVMQSHWYRRAFPDTQLSADQNEKDRFATTRRGQRIATSVGGAATA